MANKERRKDLRMAFILVFVLLVIGFISVLALTGGRGFESQTFKDRFILYSIFAIIGASFLVGIKVYRYATGADIDVPIHNPEESLLSGVKFIRNPLTLTLLVFGIFAIPVFLSGILANTFFSAPQQITVFANLWADSVFPAIAENLLFMIPIGLGLVLSWKLRSKNQALFWTMNLLVMPALIGVLWVYFHSLVYGSNEVAQVSTFVFGFVGTLITNLTFSIYGWVVIHFLTNFILGAKRYGLFSSDLFFIELVAILIAVWVAFFVTLRLSAKGNKA